MTIHINSSLVLSILLTLVWAPLTGVGAGGLTDQDKTEIIKQMLEPNLTAPKDKDPGSGQTDFDLMMRAKGGIVLSTENIQARLVPKLPGVTLQLLGQRQIQQKANREGEFMYLRFPKFQIRGDKVIVEIVRTWAIGKHSAFTPMSGGAETYEFHKESGKWISKFITGYII